MKKMENPSIKYQHSARFGFFHGKSNEKIENPSINYQHSAS